MNKSKASPLYPCPCCGYLVLSQPPPGTYLVCPICFWEDTEDLCNVTL
ncbi:MAG: CPCC family cysteine-rich protein, partial [Cyanobacteria bacterium]|nr:CPCC family cysteine-rich protein [Cyanobacteriota bacterium]